MKRQPKRSRVARVSLPTATYCEQVGVCVQRLRYGVQLATIALSSDPAEAALHLRLAIASVLQRLPQ